VEKPVFGGGFTSDYSGITRLFTRIEEPDDLYSIAHPAGKPEFPLRVAGCSQLSKRGLRITLSFPNHKSQEKLPF